MFIICKSVLLFTFYMSIAIAAVEGQPQNAFNSNQSDDGEIDEFQKFVYDLLQHNQNLYSSLPSDRIQMLISRYNRQPPYLHSPSISNNNELYRLPESKRQVRYRQCYFNPISCFKK